MEYKQRTLKQHNTEWWYYRIIAESTGHTDYEIYENMALRLLKVIDEDGDLGFIRPTCLDTRHHLEYLERIRNLAAEFGIELPDPSTEPEQQYVIKKKFKQTN